MLDRDNYTCQKCGRALCNKSAHQSHVIPKSRGNRLRWDLKNMKTLCFMCHINWWEKKPDEALDWFKDNYPNRWEYIKKHQYKKVQWRKPDYKKMVEQLKNNNKINWEDFT